MSFERSLRASVDRFVIPANARIHAPSAVRHSREREAIHRENVIKRWNRTWKLELIETRNPHWADLWDEILGTRLVEDNGFPLSRE
jgi:hypothetical protein